MDFCGCRFSGRRRRRRDEMRQLHERADASSRRDARKGEYARDGGRAGRSAHFAFFPSEVHVLGETTSAAVVGVERVGAEVDEAQRPLDSFQRASLEIHRGEGQGETDDVVGGIDRVDRWDRSGRGGGVGVLGVVRARAEDGQRRTFPRPRWTRSGRGPSTRARSSIRRRPSGEDTPAGAWKRRRPARGGGGKGVGRREGTGSVRGNESNSKRGRRTTHRADGTAGGRRRAPVRTLSNRRSRSRGRALARQSPWNCSTRLTRCGASTSSAVSAEDVARGEDARSSSRTIVASSSPPVATLASLAPGVDAFPGEDMPPEFARADPRTSRRGRVGSLRRQPARACVRQRCAPPPTSAAMTAAAFHARRVNNDEGADEPS